MSEAMRPSVQEGSDTISEHVSSRVPVSTVDASAGDIRRSLEGRRFDTAAAVAVCDDGVLRGLIGTEELLEAPDGSLASEIMDEAPPVVAPGVDQEAAAWTAVQRGEAILAVVDDAGRFLGLVPPHRLLSVLLREHDEDMARLGGFLHDASAARATSRESLLKRYWHRLPWLLIGLAGALLAATLVGSFERQLEANVMIAYFIPGIVYMADAVGTQTETIIVRGLSVGVSIREVVRRELLTGLLVGATLSLVFFPIALVWWHDADLVIATSLALLMASSIATVVAMILPWLIHRLGGDPAFGSGPLATVLQDLLSVLIYLVAVLLIVD
jgi:magnesium transporter